MRTRARRYDDPILDMCALRCSYLMEVIVHKLLDDALTDHDLAKARATGHLLEDRERVCDEGIAASEADVLATVLCLGARVRAAAVVAVNVAHKLTPRAQQQLHALAQRIEGRLALLQTRKEAKSHQ